MHVSKTFFFCNFSEHQAKDEIDAEGHVNLVRMEQLMSGALSGSQLDLVMHGPGNPTAPGPGLPENFENVNSAFLMSEKNSGARRLNGPSTP